MRGSSAHKHVVGDVDASVGAHFRDKAREKTTHLLDLYWGGEERRITTLTLRILAFNAVALCCLFLGFLLVGQKQTDVIEAKLTKVETQIVMASLALSEGALSQDGDLEKARAQAITRRISDSIQREIHIFDEYGVYVTGTSIKDGSGDITQGALSDEPLYTVQILKKIIGFLLNITDNNDDIPYYPYDDIEDRKQTPPNIQYALSGKTIVSVWQTREKNLLVSSVAPLVNDHKIAGAVFIVQYMDDIKRDIEDAWFNLLLSFLFLLIVIVFLSIYLAGSIANPLKKLAKAAENVRRGGADYDSIPDFSSRNDEIGELSISLRQMTAELAKRIDLIDRFAADVAHELKNPLTSLKSAVETLELVKSKKDKAKLKKIINHDLNRLNRLISDISNASRIDSSLSRAQPEPVHILDIISKVLDVYSDPLLRKNSKTQQRVHFEGKVITVDVQTNNTRVWGFESRLEQVLLNLISNALSFSPNDGLIKISIKNGKAGFMYVSIEDQGRGIPPNKLEDIFKRFYSQRPKEEAYGSHSGLGLSICRQIVEAAGGRIYAENIMKNQNILGAKFTIELRTV